MFLAKYLPFFLLLGVVIALKPDTECNLHHCVEKCIKSDFLIESAEKTARHMPKNAQDMNTMCENVHTAEQCTKDFISKCTENDKEKHALEHALEGMVRVVKRVCQSEDKKNEFLHHVEKCGNEILSDSKKCLNDYKMHLMAASKLDDKEKIKKIMCCKIRDIPPCLKLKMKEKGDAICTEKNMDFFKKVKNVLKEELMQDLCVDILDKDMEAKCANIEIPEGKEKVEDKTMTESLWMVMNKIL